MDQKRLAVFEAMWQAHPTSLVFARVADGYLQLGETQKALKVCLKGIEHHPSYATGYFLLGKCYRAERRDEEAKEAFERVLRLDPDYLTAYHHLAELCETSGDVAMALNYLERIAFLDPLDSITAAEINRLACQGEGDLAGSEAVPRYAEVEVANQSQGQTADDLYGDKEEAAVLASLASDVLGHPTALSPEKGETPERRGKRSTGKGRIGDHHVTKLFEEIETDATVLTSETLVEPAVLCPSNHGEIATVTLAEIYAAQGLLDRSVEIFELLLAEHPEDQHLVEKLEELKGKKFSNQGGKNQ